MANNERNQKGAQRHADGQHGDKTHNAFIKQLHEPASGDEATESAAAQGSPYGANPSDGQHRISEGREQHDEAEKNSELQKQRASEAER